jgi:peptidoglycan hydrolase-like protein with peptidoglycan-binding domain
MKRAYLIGIASLALALGTPAAIAQVNGANGANGANNGAANGAAAGGAVVAGRGAAGALVAVSPSGVREVQQALNRLGYFAGPVNGEWDRETADAMVHFQEAHGLEPTGNLNFSSIAGLGLWTNLIGNPLGNNNKSLVSSNGAPPARGNNKTKLGGEPMPSQRLTTTGGGVTGSNTTLPGQPTGSRMVGENGANAGAGVGAHAGGAGAGAGVGGGANGGGAANNGAAANRP